MADQGCVSAMSALSIVVQIIIDIIVTFLVAMPVMANEIYKIFSPNRKDVKGKLVLVTGGGNGLGRAICLKMAQEGCNIAVADVNLFAAEETAAEIKKLGVQAKAYKVDVTRSEEIIKLRDLLKTDLGPVDILVNNAGLMSNLNMEEKAENIEMMIKVNVLGTMLMTKFFLEQMKENQSGHIVSIASMSGLHPTPFSIPYSSTKYAVHGFMSALTEHLRLEKWRSKIKTTCVFPYYIKTRADVTDFLSPNIRFPALETDETAIEVVNGILREDFNVTIPNSQKSLIKIMNIWPLKVQEIIRDRVLRESGFVRKDCKLNFDFK